MSTRVYLPSSIDRLHDLVAGGGLGPAPLPGHAVTKALRAALPDLGEEEWEYVALTLAAQDSLGLLGPDQATPRRVVVVAEVDVVEPAGRDEPSAVRVGEAVPLRRVAAVHVDSPDAADEVAAAAQAWADAQGGDGRAAEVVERCLEHELGWYASQEVPDLLGD